MNEPQSDAQDLAASRAEDEHDAMRVAQAAAWRIATAGTRQEVWAEAAFALQALTRASVICLDADGAGQLTPAARETGPEADEASVDEAIQVLIDAWLLNGAPSIETLDRERIMAAHCADTRRLRGGLALVAAEGTSLTAGDQAALALIALAAGHTLGALALRAASVPLDRHEAALAGLRAEMSHTLHTGPAQDLAMANMALQHLLGAVTGVEPAIADAGRIGLAYVERAGENLRQFMARLRGEAVGDTSFHEPVMSAPFFPDLGQEEAILAIVREAIRNSRAHARAERVTVTVARDQGALRVQIDDDGRGIAGPAPAGHVGLAQMRELAVRLGGEIQITSTPGNGTTISVAVPEPPDDRDTLEIRHASRASHAGDATA